MKTHDLDELLGKLVAVELRHDLPGRFGRGGFEVLRVEKIKTAARKRKATIRCRAFSPSSYKGGEFSPSNNASTFSGKHVKLAPEEAQQTRVLWFGKQVALKDWLSTVAFASLS